jgi:hypothetical protein
MTVLSMSIVVENIPIMMKAIPDDTSSGFVIVWMTENPDCIPHPDPMPRRTEYP